MDGQLVALVPSPGEDQRYFHRHDGADIELEAGTSTTTEWSGTEHVRTIYRCPECGQQVERMEAVAR